jgi:hypothetical protein
MRARASFPVTDPFSPRFGQSAEPASADAAA